MLEPLLHTITSRPSCKITAASSPAALSKLHVGTTHDLRLTLQELLFTNSQNKAAENHPTSGRVALVFEFPDKSQQRFARAIVPSSAGSSTYVSKYHIDERTVTLDEFTKGLLKRGVNTKARNFLVFQVRTCWTPAAHAALQADELACW